MSQITLELPDKLALELRLVGDPEAAAPKLHFAPEKIAVEVHEVPKKKTFRESLKEGPTLTALASAVIAALVGYYRYRISYTQALTAQRDLQFKIIADLSDKDNLAKRAFAAAQLTQLNEDEERLEVLSNVLGDEHPEVRDQAIRVMVQMLLSRKQSRPDLYDSILKDFKATINPYLRIGILECLLRLEGHLTEKEGEDVARLLRQHLGATGERCNDTRKDEQELILAAQLSGTLPLPTSRELLVGMLENCSDDDVRIQAVYKLLDIAKRAPAEKTAISQYLKKVALKNSKGRLKDKIDQTIEALGP